MMDEVRDLVEEIMRTFQEPYSEDIIDNVFSKIEDNSGWAKKYNAILNERGKLFTNTQIGKSVKEQTGLNTLSFPNKPKSSLITSYSKLGTSSGTDYPEAE